MEEDSVDHDAGATVSVQETLNRIEKYIAVYAERLAASRCQVRELVETNRTLTVAVQDASARADTLNAEQLKLSREIELQTADLSCLADLRRSHKALQEEEKTHQKQNTELQQKQLALQHALDTAVLSHSSALVAMQSKLDSSRRQVQHEQNAREDVQRLLEEEKSLRVAAQAAASAAKLEVDRVRSEGLLEIEALRGKVLAIEMYSCACACSNY
jgi:chromosome segregation ATPase